MHKKLTRKQRIQRIAKARCKRYVKGAGSWMKMSDCMKLAKSHLRAATSASLKRAYRNPYR